MGDSLQSIYHFLHLVVIIFYTHMFTVKIDRIEIRFFLDIVAPLEIQKF
jgi:hypothetical protein